jgi:SAM-dependent methyltransferase
VEIYQSENRLLGGYYWKRITESIDIVLPHLECPQKSLVLDLGCGSGMILPTLKRYLGEIEAADLFPQDATKIVRGEKLEGVEVLGADGRSLPFSNGIFDVVFLLDILEHVTGNKELLLRECHRVIRNRGYIVCSFPIETGPVVVMRQLGRRLFGLEGNRQGLREITRHAFSRQMPPGEKNERHDEDHAHVGYDYKKDLMLVNDRFTPMAWSRVPFKHISFLSPSFIYLGRKEDSIPRIVHGIEM